MKKRTIIKIAWKEFLLKTVVAGLYRGCLLIIPILFGRTVDQITIANYNNAYISAIILIFIYVFYRIFEMLNTYTWHKLYNKLYATYTDEALNKTYNNSIFSLSRIPISEYINIMNNDVNVICDFICNIPIRIFRVIEFVIIFFYFFRVNPYFGFAGIIVSIIAFILMYISSNKIEKVNKERASALDNKTDSIHELLLCIKEIKTLNVFEHIKNRVNKKSNNYTNALLKQRLTEDAFRWSMVAFIEVTRVLIFIYGIYLISKGQMQLGVLTVIYNYYAQLVDNFSDFSAINISFRNVKVSEKRIEKIAEFSNDKVDRKRFINKKPKGELEFQNVLYGYRDDPTLKDFNLDIKGNSLTVLTGNTSSGKSGVFDLLLRLNRQHEGVITIDNIDINKYSSDEYFLLVSSVLKDPHFFNMSIKNNLSMVDDDFEKIVDICKTLEIHEYIANLVDGYDTIITNNADNIDETVKYLLGIARVLLKDSKIMLFDDTFSSLDKTTKDNIIKTLISLKKNHTVILISTDSEILNSADTIHLIDNGTIVASGTHKELKNNLIYKSI